MKITKEDISLWNGVNRSGGRFTFGLEVLNEDRMEESDAWELEEFIQNNQIFADEFNIEYMGFLTGVVGCEEDVFVQMVNKFLSNNKI